MNLVLTTNPDMIADVKEPDGIRDHDPVLSTINLMLKPPKKKPRKIFLYKKANVQGPRYGIRLALNPDRFNWDQPIVTYWAEFKSDPPRHDGRPSMGKRFWSFIKAMRKDNVGVAGLCESPEGSIIADSRTKAEILC